MDANATTKKQQETFCHGLMLGLVAELKEDYIIKSNHESSLGRYDVSLIPRDHSKLGIIMEFKINKDNQDGNAVAQAALEQIQQKKYQVELEQAGIKNILMLGMSFCGKDVVVVYKQI